MLNIQYSTSPLLFFFFSLSDHEPLISVPQAPQQYLFRLLLKAIFSKNKNEEEIIFLYRKMRISNPS